MKFVYKLLLTITLCAGLISCEESNEGLEVESFTNVDNTSIDDKTLNLQAMTRLQAKSRLLNYKDPLHIHVGGQFLVEGGRFVVNAYTTDLKKNDGTRLEFVLNTEKQIDVYLFTKDYPQFHLCTIANAISDNGVFDLGIQWAYLASTSPTVLVWNRYYSGKNKSKKDFGFFNTRNADCNSDRQGIFIDFLGLGINWGLEIQQTRINNVQRLEAYYE